MRARAPCETGETDLSRLAALHGSPPHAAIDAYREWLRGKCRRFVGVAPRLLASGETPHAPRGVAKDSLMLLAAAEVRQPHGPPLAGGAFCQMAAALALSAASLPTRLARSKPALLATPPDRDVDPKQATFLLDRKDLVRADAPRAAKGAVAWPVDNRNLW
ncbi:hypothetical protein AB1Y20_014727 [Prymnesium parvum]|uniref:Uncharacterized protein n=1 Tax=Prymnesium parvum TaxID=97485 RepID=A0AB34ICA4_PRYPA